MAVSADAMQVYEGLPILTGAATAAEQAELEHRLIGFVPITETFSAGAYADRAHDEIDALLEQGRRPIVVGGTGLYLRAALAELDLRPPVDAGDPRGGSPTTGRSRRCTPSCRAPSPPGSRATDRQRVIRAHELLEAGHEPPPPANAPSQLWTTHTRHPTLLAALVMDREALARRIDARVDAMVAERRRRGGARAPHDAGASATARRALGFQELLDGDVERHEDPHPPLRQAPAHVAAQAARRAPRSTSPTAAPDDVAAELVAMI